MLIRLRQISLIILLINNGLEQTIVILLKFQTVRMHRFYNVNYLFAQDKVDNTYLYLKLRDNVTR